MMKILITGALGFVGINLVRALAAKPGVTVIAADLHAPDREIDQFLAPVRQAVQHRLLDVTDRAAFQRLVADEGVTQIVHGAALTPSLEQERAATTTIVDVNLGGVVNALDAAVANARVDHFVLLSSSGVYGLTAQSALGQIDEDAPLVLDNLYAITKRSGELLTARYATLHSKPMTAVRLGPIYGPMERSSSSRERLSGPGQLLAATRAGRAVHVFGGDVSRDWTYAGDVGAALWSLLGALSWHYPVYNLSYGRGVPFRQMVDAFVAQGLTATWNEPGVDEGVGMIATQTRTPMSNARLAQDAGRSPATAPAAGVAETIALDAGGQD